MGIFNFVLDSFKGVIFDFKVDRQVLVASTVNGFNFLDDRATKAKFVTTKLHLALYFLVLLFPQVATRS